MFLPGEGHKAHNCDHQKNHKPHDDLRSAIYCRNRNLVLCSGHSVQGYCSSVFAPRTHINQS